MRDEFVLPGFAALAALLAVFAPASALGQDDDTGYCLSGSADPAYQHSTCSGRWRGGDEERFDRHADPYGKPHEAYRAYSGRSSAWADAHGEEHNHTTSFADAPVNTYRDYDYYATAPVVEPGDPYRPGPVVVTHGRTGHRRTGGYEVYVPLYAGYGTACRPEGTGHARRCAAVPPQADCTHCHRAATARCFRRDARGHTMPISCPASQDRPQRTHATAHSAASASASATASASASARVSNAGFYNSLTGGVGGPVASFYGGGGIFVSGGHGSVLSRAPLLRFRHRHRGHGGGHMCGCGGGD